MFLPEELIERECTPPEGRDSCHARNLRNGSNRRNGRDALDASNLLNRWNRPACRAISKGDCATVNVAKPPARDAANLDATVVVNDFTADKANGLAVPRVHLAAGIDVMGAAALTIIKVHRNLHRITKISSLLNTICRRMASIQAQYTDNVYTLKGDAMNREHQWSPK